MLATWPLNWLLPGPRTHVLFFPLWVGYILVVDGLTRARTGTSMLSRSGRELGALFVVSIPAWWLFELLNRRLQNWEYVGREHFTDLEYAALCSLSFSTVMPAVFVTAELVRGFGWIERFARGPRISPSGTLHVTLVLAGALMLGLMLAWPRAFYPFVWVSGVFLLEPLCHSMGRTSLTSALRRGDWRPWMALWAGVLVCGFFWEMWNFLSYPKWIYHVPGVDFARLFEMPAFGYLGYLPFALELFLLKQLIMPGRAEPRL